MSVGATLCPSHNTAHQGYYWSLHQAIQLLCRWLVWPCGCRRTARLGQIGEKAQGAYQNQTRGHSQLCPLQDAFSPHIDLRQVPARALDDGSIYTASAHVASRMLLSFAILRPSFSSCCHFAACLFVCLPSFWIPSWATVTQSFSRGGVGSLIVPSHEKHTNIYYRDLAQLHFFENPLRFPLLQGPPLHTPFLEPRR
jgi:hypothetical protein